MKNIKQCTICYRKKIIFVEIVRNGKFKFVICKCDSCGLMFQNPMPDKKYLKKFYENIYSKKYCFASTENAFEKKNVKQEINRIKFIEKFVSGGNILDVGASTGFFLSEVKRKNNWKTYGVEYSKKAADKANKNFNLNIIHGDISSSRVPDNFFDVITMHSVLEHIPNLKETIFYVNKKLKKGGFFIFSVPNISSFEYVLFRVLKKPFPGFIVEHLYYFTPNAITQLLVRHGFVVVSITSRHYSNLNLPGLRPIIGIFTFITKLFLEYTEFGGKLKRGNILYVSAKKVN